MCGDLEKFEAMNRPIRQTFLAALDQALVVDDARGARAGSFDRHSKLVDRLDECVDRLGHRPLHGDEIARAIGVSVRTLQTATQTIHGMSLHRYLRFKRMWSVRKQLATGRPGLTVKAAAMANGFRHMGEFSRAYETAFGEMPSETLARGRLR